MKAKQLGAKVLTKIQSLISEIDRATNRAPNRFKGSQKNPLEEVQGEQEKVYNKMSYTYKKRQVKIDKFLKDQIYQDSKSYEPFKITNQHTLKILNRKVIKPIHERTGDIIAKKNRHIRNMQLNFEQKENQAMRPRHRSTDTQAGKKYNQRDLQDYCRDIDSRNKERIKKQHMQKLHLVKIDQSKIPVVNEASRCLSEHRNLKKNYSDNVFTRMAQYSFELKSRKIELMQDRRKQEGNFEPVLCSKSIEIAQKKQTSMSKSQRSFHHHSRCQLRLSKDNANQKVPKLTSKNTNKIPSPLKQNTMNLMTVTSKTIQKKTNQTKKRQQKKENKTFDSDRCRPLGKKTVRPIN